MWVVNDGNIFAYKMSGKEWGEPGDSKTFALDMENQGGGIWSNGTTFWVSDTFERKIFAYKYVDDDHYLEYHNNKGDGNRNFWRT